MLNQDWIQGLLSYDTETGEGPSLAAPEDNDKTICRAVIDGVLVIYDLDDPPAWLVPVLEARDEDGNTVLSGTIR